MATDDTKRKIPESSRDFTITNAKVIGLLAALVIYLSVDFISNIATTPHSRIDRMGKSIYQIDDAIDVLEQDILNIKNDDDNCIKRQAKLETSFEKFELRFDALYEKVTTYQSETKRRDDTQEFWLRTYMGIPEYHRDGLPN